MCDDYSLCTLINIKMANKKIIKFIDTKKRIAFDLDGTLTKKGYFPNIWDITPKQLLEEYEKVKPDKKMIKIINRLYDMGYIVYIFTSRSNLFQRQTKKWLDRNGVKYHYIVVDKPYFDRIVDDKSVDINKLKRYGIKYLKL